MFTVLIINQIINKMKNIMTTQETITQAKKQLAVQDDAHLRFLVKNLEMYISKINKQ